MQQQTVERLQDLVKINIDSYKGFEQAAETIDNAAIADLFRAIAVKRRRHAEELRDVITISDEEAEDSGSIKGTMHRWWLSTRGTLSGGDDHAVLSEAERGEDAIKHEYENAMNTIDDTTTRDMVGRQYAEVKSGHDQIRNMRDARSNG